MMIKLKIDEIWVHRACTTRPQEDTIYYIYAVRQGGLTHYAWKKYEINMRVKDHRNQDGSVIPYTRVFEHAFDIDANLPTKFSFLLADYSGNSPYEHLKGLIDSFDASSGQSMIYAFPPSPVLYNNIPRHRPLITSMGLPLNIVIIVDHFSLNPNANNGIPALDLVRVVAANLIKFDPVGALGHILQKVVEVYFTNKDAPVAYDRVEKAMANQVRNEERYARDYHGSVSVYGVAFKDYPFIRIWT